MSDDQPVYELDDGGMGSFGFAPDQQTGHPVSEATYLDDDDVEVRITLFIDENGRPTEVEMWKVDFGRLISFPSPNQLRDVRAIE